MPFRSLLKLVSRAPAPAPALSSHRASDERSEIEAPKAPECPHCKIVMRWFKSMLHRDNGSQSIVHSFYCEDCGGLVDVRQPVKKAVERLVA